MTTHQEYELTFSQPFYRAPSRTVVVRRTETQGPGGHPVYCDETGAVRVEISDRGECRMLSSGAQGLRRPSAWAPRPAADAVAA